MLTRDQIASLKEAADAPPSDNVQVEHLRGMLGLALDAYARAAEGEAMRGNWAAREQVLALHEGRRR